jgi:hypothetical protein
MSEPRARWRITPFVALYGVINFMLGAIFSALWMAY